MVAGTFLGIDFGTKRMGVAVGQTITKTATPLMTLPATNQTALYDQLIQVITEWQPDGLVIGLALQPDGSHSTTSYATQKFAKTLYSHCHLPIYFIEERLLMWQVGLIVRSVHLVSIN